MTTSAVSLADLRDLLRQVVREELARLSEQQQGIQFTTGPVDATARDANLECLSVKDAARFLGVSAGTVYRLTKAGELPTKRLGARVTIPRAALERYVAQADPQPLPAARKPIP
ncbi:MAG TPA: helix-turn-helix domain-containing protein [Deinococcales bacterium]|nr:helix-turn-helix domain-containing protein [Deinococcales bacterium]